MTYRASPFYNPFFILLLSVFLFSAGFIQASHPKKWVDNSWDDFVQGETQGTRVLQEGAIKLSLHFSLLADLNESIIWDAWKEGSSIYIATGHKGKVFRLDLSNLEKEIIADLDESEAQALAFWRGKLYIAGNPGAKLYRWDPKTREIQVAWESEESYIWDLVPWKGKLIVATGDDGKIFALTTSGEAELLFDASDQNILRLFVLKDTLYAGASGIGNIYKLTSSGGIRVLFPANHFEISALSSGLVGSSSLVFASSGPGVREKKPSKTPRVAEEIVVRPSSTKKETNDTKKPKPTPPPTPVYRPAYEQSSIWSMNPDGFLRELWSFQNAWVYDIAEGNGTLWIATGSPAKLFALDKNEEKTLHATFHEESLSRILVTKERLLVFSSNPARVYGARFFDSLQGVYISDVKDVGQLSYWGTWSTRTDIPSGTSLKCYIRTGNTQLPDETWSQWFGPLKNETKIEFPPSRYFQYKCEMKGTWDKSPVLREVRLSYLPQNHPPKIDSILVYPPGYAFQSRKQSKQQTIAGSEHIPLYQTAPQKNPARSKRTSNMNRLPSGRPYIKPGVQTIAWKAHDPDQDTLIASIFIQKAGSSVWKKLADHIEKNVFAWDTSTLEEGWYRIKVRVSDKKSNLKKFALSHELTSEWFPIDHTPPEVQVLSKTKKGNQLEFHIRITDTISPLLKVEKSTGPDTWEILYPVDFITDSKREEYIFSTDLSNTFRSVAIRVTDMAQNSRTLVIRFP